MVGATRQGIVDDQITLNTVTNCPKQERMIQLAHHNITEAEVNLPALMSPNSLVCTRCSS